MFYVKFRRFFVLVKLVFCGLFKMLKVNELLFVVVILMKMIFLRLVLIIVGMKINFGGKLVVESE